MLGIIFIEQLSICSAHLPSLTEDTAYLVFYLHARLDNITIPEYFAPPGVFLFLPLRGE
jgi:hypothetical protein